MYCAADEELQLGHSDRGTGMQDMYHRIRSKTRMCQVLLKELGMLLRAYLAHSVPHFSSAFDGDNGSSLVMPILREK
jgi:hypothetical protein